MRYGLAATAALVALAGSVGGPDIGMPLMPTVPTSYRSEKGGKREHSKRHTGQAKIRREAKRLRNKRRRNQ